MPPSVANTAILTYPVEVPVTSELDDIETLVHTYRPRILRYVAFSVHDMDIAESITQDCFLKAYNSRASFRGDCAVSTWLISIAANLVRDHTRTQKFKFWKNVSNTSVDVTEMAHQIASSFASAERGLLAKEQVAHVQRALQDLSTKQRSVFVMRFMEEMSLDEISEAMQMPVATIKTHLHRAVTAIRSQIKNQAAKGAAR